MGMGSASLASLRQGVRNHRARRPLGTVAQACEKYLRAYYNEAFFEFESNGERRLIDTYAGIVENGPYVHVDVGAHTGEWTESALAAMPASRVVCFEIVPEVAAQLRDRLGDDDRVTIIDKGLSSQPGEVSVTFNRSAPSTSSIAPRASSEWFVDADLEQVSVQVETGDAVMERLGLTQIGILKIDVEGHEIDVLRGFEMTLRAPAGPRLIQFEYGETYLPVRHPLHEAFELLSSCGYVVGRIFPRGVEFKDYALRDDHFRMGNYVAVRSNDLLRAALQGEEFPRNAGR